MTQDKMTTAQLWDAVQREHLPHGWHETDLYLEATPRAGALIHAYEWRNNCTTFTGADGRRYYDVPFAYLPAWNRRKSNA